MTDNNTKRLAQAILSLTTEEEVVAFLADICTPGEVKALSERLLVAKLLNEKKTYRDVAEEAGVALATVTRVARFLLHEHHRGYETVLSRI